MSVCIFVLLRKSPLLRVQTIQFLFFNSGLFVNTFLSNILTDFHHLEVVNYIISCKSHLIPFHQFYADITSCYLSQVTFCKSIKYFSFRTIVLFSAKSLSAGICIILFLSLKCNTIDAARFYFCHQTLHNFPHSGPRIDMWIKR